MNFEGSMSGEILQKKNKKKMLTEAEFANRIALTFLLEVPREVL